MRARIINSDTGPEVQWGEDGPSFAFERGDDTSLLIALTKAVNVGVEAGDEIEGDVEKVIGDVLRKAAGDLAWPPGEGFNELREKVSAELPKNANGYSDYSVDDISRDGQKALVCSWKDGDNKYWVIPISLHGSGGEEVVVIPALSEWVEVEREYVVTKAGRVLSAKNLRLVMDAASALAALAEAARRAEAAPAEGEEATTKATDEDWEGVEYLPLRKTASDPMRYTFGPLYAPDRSDAHGEWVEDVTLHKAVHEFVRESADNGREIHLQHGDKGDMVVGEWVEVARWPYDHEIVVKSKDGDYAVEMPEGTIYMGVVWGEDYWDEKAGRPKGIEGLSLGGRAVKVAGGDATMKAMGWKDGKKPKAGYPTKKAAEAPAPGITHRQQLQLLNTAAAADEARHRQELARADREGQEKGGLVQDLIATIGKAFEQQPPETHIHLPEQNVTINEDSGLEKLLPDEEE